MSTADAAVAQTNEWLTGGVDPAYLAWPLLHTGGMSCVLGAPA